MGRIDLNAAPFLSGLKAAERGADQFVGKIRNQIGGTLAGVFGVRSLARIGQEAIDNGHKIAQMANKFNLTTDEVQLLQKEADRTGTSFETLVSDAEKLEATLKRISGGEVIFSRQMVQELDEAHAKIKVFNDELAKQGAKAIEGGGNFWLKTFGKVLSWGVPFGPKLFDKMFPDQGPAQGAAGADQFLADDAAKKRASVRIEYIKAELLKVREQVGQAQLDDEERVNKLAKEREAIFARVAKTQEERHQKELDLARNELEIIKAKERLKMAVPGFGFSATDPTRFRFSPTQDGMRSIGNFLGSNPNATEVKLLSEITSLNKEVRAWRADYARRTNAGDIFPAN